MAPYLKFSFVASGLNILVSITSTLCVLGPNIRPAAFSLYEAITKVARLLRTEEQRRQSYPEYSS